MDESSKASNEIHTQIDYTTPAPRFSVTNDDTLNDGLTYLTENGYTVISDIMNGDEIALNKDLLWKFLETVGNSSIRRDDPETWSNEWLESDICFKNIDLLFFCSYKAKFWYAWCHWWKWHWSI